MPHQAEVQRAVTRRFGLFDRPLARDWLAWFAVTSPIEVVYDAFRPRWPLYRLRSTGSRVLVSAAMQAALIALLGLARRRARERRRRRGWRP